MIISQEQILQLHQYIETPALIVDLQQLEKNIKVMQNLANENAVRLRPHIKTHKSVFISKLLLKNGAEGITVAKVGEAEVMAAAGISDIFIVSPLFIFISLFARLVYLLKDYIISVLYTIKKKDNIVEKNI